MLSGALGLRVLKNAVIRLCLVDGARESLLVVTVEQALFDPVMDEDGVEEVGHEPGDDPATTVTGPIALFSLKDRLREQL